jgi:uncharacterized membrane protein YgdD (TMEM256/DUF423 family)
MRAQRLLVALAGLNGLLAVGLGAFGAHAITDPQAKEWLETATRFQLPTAVAVLAVLALWPRGRWAALLLGVGALLFAGALQALALGAPRGVAMLAPLGGSLMLLGWVAVIDGALRQRR